MPTLRSWSIRGDSPTGMRLVGVVTGHPRREDGEEIITSPIVKILSGDAIETLSGTLYKLEGLPEAGYAAYLEARPNKDPKNPMTALIDHVIAAAKAKS